MMLWDELGFSTPPPEWEFFLEVFENGRKVLQYSAVHSSACRVILLRLCV